MHGSAAQDQFTVGAPLAGLWIVERTLDEVAGVAAVLARGIDGGRAIVFALPTGAPDPPLDDDAAVLWGAARRILRDPELGRIVVDEIPEGQLLADRLSLGLAPSQGAVDELWRRVRATHRRGEGHGQLAPDRIVLGPEGLVVAGWGLGGEDAEQRRARDLASLSRFSGLAGPGPRSPAPTPNAQADESPPASGPPTGEASGGAPSVHRLQAAVVSGHLPTLRQVLEEWTQNGGAEDHPAALRGRDALARLQRKVAECIEEARRRLAAGDPLGAVAPCREAIRLGAEPEAAPLLRQARRQARQMVGTRRWPSWRVLGMAIGGGLAVLLLVIAGVLAVSSGRGDEELREQVDGIAQKDGERAALMYLLARRERGADSAALDAVLVERLEKLAEAEEKRLEDLRRHAASQGARPRAADQEAGEAIAHLQNILGNSVDSPTFGPRVQEVFTKLDRAAQMYRAAAGLSGAAAARAVDLLVAKDPAFAPPGSGR